jgi:uncharacterized protein (TIGR00255 family)
MLKSMTAFGRAENTAEGRAYTVEIRSLNRRYLETVVRLPRELLPLEERIKKLIAQRISRGRIDVTVSVRRTHAAAFEIEINLPLAKAYYYALRELSENLGLDDQVKLETVLGMEGIVTGTEPEMDLEQTWTALSSCVGDALDEIDTMRISEGEAIYREFQERLQQVETGLSEVKALAPDVLSQCHSRLKERISLLTEGKVELDPGRLAQEAAFLVDKGDITEEIVRAASHLQQFHAMMESDGPTGRALDFLLQELNREVNTMGSKASDARLAHIVVNVKSELEKIREQVQNLE